MCSCGCELAIHLAQQGTEVRNSGQASTGPRSSWIAALRKAVGDFVTASLAWIGKDVQSRSSRPAASGP